MIRARQSTFTCPICNQERRITEAVHQDVMRAPLLELLKKKHPTIAPENLVCLQCLNTLRAEYVEDILETEKGQLTNLEKNVVESLKEEELLSKNLNLEFDTRLTLGQHIADKVAEFGGSWKFIITFGAIIVVWIGVNAAVLLSRAFDPYPFILLNLVLSCLAALQAPVIMMSQNRLESKDRLRSEHDYQVNLKAELEVRHLNQKLDLLLTQQWQRLLEIQQIQLELLEELLSQGGSRATADS